MKIKNYLLLIITIFICNNITAQVVKPFTQRVSNLRLKGDIVMVGNNIINLTTTQPTYASGTNNLTNQATLLTEANIPYTGTANNNGQNFDYIDIDGDASTFNSSSANLAINSSCKRVVYAGLYWSATYQWDRRKSDGTIITPRKTTWNEVKFKLPGGTYQNLVADNLADAPGQEDDIIVDNNFAYPVGDPNFGVTPYGKPYVCYKNVTGLVQSLGEANGTYTVADMLTERGNSGIGSSAGWSMVIIYEDPNLPSKFFSNFDGYSFICTSGNQDFAISGFTTLPAPFQVKARFGVAGLEGDVQLNRDNVLFKAASLPAATPFTPITNTLNPFDNFFNSSITNNNVNITNRVPASSNTLGFDLDIVSINNPPGNTVIPNNETAATIRLTTGNDCYGVFLTTFDVEIIEPQIILTKTVENALGAPIPGADLALDQPYQYTIGFQNIGNDNAINFTVRDVLPPNIVFDGLATSLTLPPGVTFTYNAATRVLIFTIPNALVPKNGPRYTIILKVRVVKTCNELDDACSNQITNQAFATYRGADNATLITDDPSLSSFSACNVSPPSPTNKLVGTDACNFTTNVVLCGTTVTLTAAPGYQTYTWSGPLGATITPVSGTNNQSVVVNQVGTYTVNNLITISPCKSIQQTIIVQDISGAAPIGNPIIPLVIPGVDIIRDCPIGNINRFLPEIILCGAGATRDLTINITGAASYSWERLNVGSCPAVSNPNCPNTDNTCTWTVVDTDGTFTANASGQYRIVINFSDGNGGFCPRVFYFNVYKDPLNPTITPRDAVCTTPGTITIANVPAGYEYQLNCTGTYASITGNPFTFNVPVNSYSLCIRQTGVTGGCVFTFNGINVAQRQLTTSEFITQPKCATDKGCIRIDAIGAYPQYSYTVNQLTPTITTQSFGPTTLTSTVAPTFCSLSPGTYTYTVTTPDGCSVTKPFTIINPPAIKVTAGITRPLSCVPPGGQITAYPADGTIVPPATAPVYGYNVTGPPGFTPLTASSNPVIDVTLPGTYNITVYDGNNCTATTSILINAIPPPVFTVSGTNVLCYGANTGTLSFNVTNTNGHTLAYSYDNGVTFSPSATLANQVAGTYQLVLQYTFGTAVCLSAPQTVTITQPFAALTASAGVSELAGCGPLGEGKVRITNPQGGVPAYTYSFNNQDSYSPINEAFLQCGTYTVYIKDANGCIFAMPVTLDCAPTPPTIVVTPPVFACTGNATSTVTVNNNGGNFTYTYAISPPLVPPHNPLSNIFNNVQCGNSVVTVNYKAINIPTPSNLLFEDFGIGANTTTPGIAAAYCFNPQAYPPGQPCGNFVAGFPASVCGSYSLEDNGYVVTSAINPNNCAWHPFRDHTSATPGPLNPNGRFLAINIGGAAGPNGILYSKTINDVLPNQPIFVEAYVANLLRANLVGGVDPSFAFEIATTAGVPIQTVTSTDILRSDTWQLRTVTLNPGANTSLIFRVRSGSVLYGGNDAAIDDIRVFQEPIACITTRNFPINIACGQAFTADVTSSTNVTCNGLTNGTITISAQNFDPVAGYQYSLNGAAGPWVTITTSPYVIPNVAGSVTPYNVQIRYNALAANATCSYSESVTVSQPNAITGSVNILPATCSTGATITVTASGGTGALQYQLLTPANGVVPGFVGYQASNVFSNVPFLPTGNYIVLVRDANQCVITTPIPANVVAPVSPTAVIEATSNYCYSSPAGASLTITASGGLPPYRYYNNAVLQPSNIISGLIPGTYTISILDAANCPFAIAIPVVIEPQLTAGAVLTKELTCFAPQAAVITTTIAGGYVNYSYQVNTNVVLGASVPVIGNTFTYSPPLGTTGTFFFVITDSRGCKTQTNSITINPLVNPTALNPQTNVSCNGLSDGSFVINASLGIPGYTYSYNGSPTFTNVTSYTGLAAGTYTYIVRDSKGCVFNGSVTITQPSAITGVLTLTTPYNCGQNGVVTVSGVTGGTPPYSYSINGNAGPFQLTPLTFPVTAGGNYVVTIKDDKGCTFNTNTINVLPLNPPTNITFATTALSCPGNTSNVILTVIGGSGTLSYQQILPTVGVAQSSNVFTVSPGTYTYEVTDARNCKYQESITITPLPPVTVTANPSINVACFASSTGTISFNVGSFGASYSYVITGPVGSAGTAQTAPLLNVNLLPAGTYTIVVTNTATSCFATTSATILQPTTALAILPLTPTAVTCRPNGNASVTVNTTGGWGGNTYSMSPLPVGVSQAGNVFTNIPVGGPYTITVTDANGCVVSSSFSLTGPVGPTATISTASDFCFDTVNGATIVVTPAGGVGPYTYSYTANGGAITPNPNNTFSNLSPGISYLITVTDFLGCPFTLPVQVIAPQLTVNVDTKGLDCTATPNATFSGTITGGYPGYTVTVNGVAGPVVVGNTFTYNTALAGTYQFLVTDNKGCTVQSIIYNVTPISFPQVTATQSAFIQCNGDSTAAINVVINPAVGTAPFSFVVQQILPISFNYGTQVTGLPAGTYTVTLTDGKSCTDVKTVVTGQPAIIAYTTTINPIVCSGAGPVLGSICINAPTGGTPPYTYELIDQGTGLPVPTSPFGPTPSVTHCFTGINFGLYTAEVTDANGCTIIKTNLKMASPPNDIVFVVTPIVATCALGATVSVTVGGTVLGVGPFLFGVVNAPAPLYSTLFVPPSNPLFTHVFTGLPTGSIVTVVVKDVISGCLYFETFPTALPSNSNLTSVINAANPVTCNGSANGTANATVNNYTVTTTNIAYAVYDFFGVVVAGTSGNVPVPGGPVAPFAINNIGPLAPGTYTIRFVELGGLDPGCGATSAPFTITQSATPLLLSASATKNDNCNLNAGQITAVPSGGTGPYRYLFLPSPSVVPLPSAIIAINNVYNAESGTYDVYVKDANGCIVSDLGNILPLAPTPVVAATLVNACVVQSTYAINVTLPTIGVGPYSYYIDNSLSSNTIAPFTVTNLNSGTHTVEVRDFNGCGNTVSVTILAPLVVAASFTVQPTCFNSNGTITVVASGGLGNYEYTLLNSGGGTILGPQALNTFGSQPAGSYIIKVTDTTTLCSEETPFSLVLPTPVSFSAPTTLVSCFGGSDGTITINLPASNNNPVYTYAITVGPVGLVYPIAPVGNVFSGLLAGTYTVLVTSGRGCSLTDNLVIVGSPTQVIASGSATAFTCAANGTVNQSVLTVTGTNGTPGYTYSINGTNYFSTNTFPISNTGAIQTITVYVKDAKGCIDTEVVVINPLPGITSALITQNTILTCALPRTELITINPVGGSGNYTYQVLPAGAPNVTQVGTTNQFNITQPGTYFFQVNDVTTGCSFATLPYTILPFNLINVVASPSAPVVCFGNSNGAISVNVTGYSGPYTYTVIGATPPIVNVAGNTTTNPLIISGLAAGSYTVEITETATPFCVFTSNITTVASPTQVGLTLVSNINANCNTGAVVTVSGFGGTPGYQYAFMPNGVIPVFPVDYAVSNIATLNPATSSWDVYVRDANGCNTFIDVIIDTDVLPTVTLPTFANNQCSSTGTSYTFTATGTGLPPLTYDVNGSGFNTSNIFTVSAPGSYVVTIKDKNGCTATANITVYPPIGIDALGTTFPTCATNDGVITVNTTGGSGTYTYTILPNVGTLIGNVFSNVPFGFYTITTIDALTGCSKIDTVDLPAPTPVTFTAVPKQVTCAGSTDGTITVTLPASNNNPIYTYAITAGPSLVPASTNNVFTGLATGTYTVLVTSGQGCTLANTTVFVDTPNPIVVPAPAVVQFGCTAGTNVPNLATITVTGVTGGSNIYPIYEFVLGGTIVQTGPSNVYSTSATIGGTYTINVRDSKGCLGTGTAIINPYISISNPTVVIDKLIDCNTGEDITVSVTTTGGVPPIYTYNATKVPVAILPPYNQTNNTGDFNNLPIGDYLITVTNTVTGCSVNTFHYVNTPNTFNLVASNFVTTTCFGGSDGSVQLTVVDTNLVPTNDAGLFTWTILNGATVVQSSGPVPTANAGPITILGLASGVYTANIILFNSPFCPVTKNFTIVQPDAALVVTATKTVITCVPGADGTITASATGGWGTNYQFQLQIGAAIVNNPATSLPYSYSSTSLFTGLSAGNYTVYVRDEKGCVDTFDINLVNLPAIAAIVTANTPLLNCFGETNGSITISYPTGGQGSNYNFIISGTLPTLTPNGPRTIPVGGITLTNLPADVYTIDIYDGYGCVLNRGATIAQPTQVTAALSTNTTATCLTQATLLLTGSGGTPPYRYQLNGTGALLPAVAFASSTVISVPVGTYQYVITDANGCRSFPPYGGITIDPITPLTISPPVVGNILCGGLPNGNISVVASGGLLNYVYTITNSLGNPVVATQASQGVFSNLLAGSYIITVTSLDCIERTGIITITEPPAFVYTLTPALVKCNGDATGAITVSYRGGTGPYTYYISPDINVPINLVGVLNTLTGNLDFTISGLAAGSYSVIIRDANGCFTSPVSNTIVIGQPTPLTSAISAFVNEVCGDENLGSITLGSISGGTTTVAIPYYTVSYTAIYPNGSTFTLPPVNLASGANSYVFNNLDGGEYTTVVTDANGCISEKQVTIGSGVTYEPRAFVSFPCVNNVPAVEVVVTNALNFPTVAFDPLADYLFNLDVNDPATAQASPIFTSSAHPTLLIPGSHIIYVFNANGCSKDTQVFTITAADIDALTLTLSNPSGSLNTILATSTGGSGGNNYTFNGDNNGSNNIYVYDQSGNYTVTVTDSSACFRTVTQPFTFIPIKIPNGFTPNGNGVNDGWGPTNTSNYPNLVTRIYDRYGRKLIEMPEGKFWDGKYDGQELPSGDYWYVVRVDAKNDSEYVGHFTLYR